MKVFSFLSIKLRVCCILVIGMSAVGACLTATWPVLLSEIYDGISVGIIDRLENGITPVLTFGLIFLIAETCTIIRRVCVDKIAVSFEKNLRNRSMKKLLYLPTEFFGENLSGEYTAKINQSVAGASQLVKVVCNNIVPSVLIGFFTIFQVVKNAPILMAMVFASYVMIEIFVSSCQIKSQNGIREKLIRKKAKLDGIVCQSIQNIEMIRVTNAEEYELGRIEPFTDEIRNVESKHHSFMGGFDCIKQSIKVVYTIGIMMMSLVMVSKGFINAGMVITIILLFQQLVVPIDAIHVFMDEMASSSVKAKELLKLMEREEDHIFSVSLKDVPMPNGDISISDLSVYTPDKRKVICAGKTFTIQEGKVTALRGPTGCGKSSILKAIMRFYPAYGSVTVGNCSLMQLTQNKLCDAIYDMVQQPIFVSGTIKDNLVYGLSIVPEDSELIEALKNALIFDELYERTGDVLSLAVLENASNYSGGQRQRLALARVFLRKPKWIFVDEATANIDEATTLKVFQNLKTHARAVGAGILCISHQESVVNSCDEVIDLVNFDVA